MSPEEPKVFLCHASEDKTSVLEVYNRLQAEGLKPWLDKKDLLPGQVWSREIPKAIKKSDFVLIFFSSTSVTKRGYVQKEFNLALEVLDQMPDGQIFIIPVRLDECRLPDRFQHLHYCDLFKEDGLEQVLRAIKLLKASLIDQPAETSEHIETKKQVTPDIQRPINEIRTQTESKSKVISQRVEARIHWFRAVLFAIILVSAVSAGVYFFKNTNTPPITEVKRSVVKITVEKPGGVIEIGAGIILSTHRQVTFILTAYHILDAAQSITVTLYEYAAEEFPGTVFERIDEDNDLAVVYIKSSAIPEGIPKLQLGDLSKTNELDKIIAIGHSFDNEWQLSTGVVRSSEPSHFRFVGDAVDFGNSGGALLNEQFQLIGLITRWRGGIAFKIDDALEILRHWKVPFDFELRRNGWKWGWWAAGLGVAGIVAFIAFSLSEKYRRKSLRRLV